MPRVSFRCLVSTNVPARRFDGTICATDSGLPRAPIAWFFSKTCFPGTGRHKLCQPGSLAVEKWKENEKMKRKWRENEEMERKWREIHSLHFLIFSLFPPSLSISYIKNCLTLSQNVKCSTFVANFTKNLTRCERIT